MVYCAVRPQLWDAVLAKNRTHMKAGPGPPAGSDSLTQG